VIPQGFIQDLPSSVDLLDVVDRHVELKKIASERGRPEDPESLWRFL